jgi:hypothetical protein
VRGFGGIGTARDCGAALLLGGDRGDPVVVELEDGCCSYVKEKRL